MRLPNLPSLALLALALFTAAGCKQGDGERCQLDSDCSEGLRCCYSVANPTPEQIIRGGVCTQAERCNTTPADLGLDVTTTDAVNTDSKADAPKTDGPKPDAAKPDATKPKPDGPKTDGPKTDATPKG